MSAQLGGANVVNFLNISTLQIKNILIIKCCQHYLTLVLQPMPVFDLRLSCLSMPVTSVCLLMLLIFSALSPEALSGSFSCSLWFPYIPSFLHK